MTIFQKRVKQILTGPNAAISHEVLICKKDGSVEVKRVFFYRHGRTAAKWATDIGEALQGHGLSYEVNSREDWRDWPATSHFVAIVTERKS